MAMKRVSKESLIGSTLLFNAETDSEIEQIEHSFAMNHIDVISLDGLDGNPVIPTTGTYEIYVRTDIDGGFKLIPERGSLEAIKTGGSILADGIAEGVSFTGFPLEFKIVPTGVDVAAAYRVDIKQSSVQLSKIPDDFIDSFNREGVSTVLNTGLFDGYGNPIGSLKGALNIHDADVHNQVINKYMHQHTGVTTTLTAATTGDGTEYQIEIADADGFADLDYIHMNGGSPETTHPQIISSVPALPTTGPAVFTLDRRLDVAHSIGDAVEKSIINMASQDGTMAAPQEYWVGPIAGEVWHVTRILFEMTHDVSGDLGKFGGIPALINGVLFRARINGQYGTFTNWKKNGNIKTDMYDVEFDARSGGQGLFGTSGRGSFYRAGAVIRLDGDTNDRLELYIQDTMTGLGLNTFTMKAQGHPEEL